MTGGVGFAGDGAGRGRNNRRMMDERRKRNFKNAGRREDYGDSEAIYSKEEAIEKRKDYLKMKERKTTNRTHTIIYSCSDYAGTAFHFCLIRILKPKRLKQKTKSSV